MDLRPTYEGFVSFVRDEMGISTAVLPDGSKYLGWAYHQACHLVNTQIAQADQLMYMIAVYNLGGDTLVNIAQDPPGAPTVPGTKPPMAFFAYTRKKLNLNSFVTGVITSTSDEGTSESMQLPDWVKGLTLADLQSIKTPWGQKYLGIAQSVGSLWGLS